MITFVINDTQPELSRDTLLPNLLTRWLAQQQGPLFCLVADEKQAETLDHALWHQEPSSFIPHEVGAVAETRQVYIGWNMAMAQGARVVFNCQDAALADVQADCEHIEFGGAADKTRLRTLYKTYQQQNHPLSSIRI